MELEGYGKGGEVVVGGKRGGRERDVEVCDGEGEETDGVRVRRRDTSSEYLTYVEEGGGMG